MMKLQRDTPQWEHARENAYRHPSGLFCFRGTLTDYPGYIDEQHPRDMAAMDLQIVTRMVNDKRHMNPNQQAHLVDNYTTYLGHCHDGRMKPVRSHEADALLFEPLRQHYHHQTGRLLLPFPFHYTGNDDLVRQLVDDPRIEPLFTLQWHERKRRMNQSRHMFDVWWGSRRTTLPNMAEQLQALAA